MRLFGAGQTEPKVNSSGAGLDRLATCTEIRCALEVSLNELMYSGNTYEGYETVQFAMTAHDQILRNEIAWLALASETPESMRN